jgi:CheY-like chemotaxis protein
LNDVIDKSRILIVDDEPAVIEILIFNLEEAGYSVEPAQNGIEALKKIDVFKPSLIITDISMPDMEGIEFLRRLKKAGNSIPVIVMSGNIVGKNFLTAAEKLGARETIKKPFAVEEILELIEKVLGT